MVRNGRGCQGVNAGTLLIALGNLMKLMRYAFVVDSQTPFSTNEVWNQPAYRYTVNEVRPLGEESAPSSSWTAPRPRRPRRSSAASTWAAIG